MVTRALNRFGKRVHHILFESETMDKLSNSLTLGTISGAITLLASLTPIAAYVADSNMKNSFREEVAALKAGDLTFAYGSLLSRYAGGFKFVDCNKIPGRQECNGVYASKIEVLTSERCNGL